MLMYKHPFYGSEALLLLHRFGRLSELEALLQASLSKSDTRDGVVDLLQLYRHSLALCTKNRPDLKVSY